MIASRLGKMPTESVRRRISRLRCSSGLSTIGTTRPRGTRRRPGCRPGGIEVLGDRGQLLGHVIQGAVELGVDVDRRWPVINGVQDRLHRRSHALRGHAHQVRRVVGAATLPGRAGQVRGNRVLQTGMRVTGDQLHAGEAVVDEVCEERIDADPVSSARFGGRALRGGVPLTPVAISTTVSPPGHPTTLHRRKRRRRRT